MNPVSDIYKEMQTFHEHQDYTLVPVTIKKLVEISTNNPDSESPLILSNGSTNHETIKKIKFFLTALFHQIPDSLDHTYESLKDYEWYPIEYNDDFYFIDHVQRAFVAAIFDSQRPETENYLTRIYCNKTTLPPGLAKCYLSLKPEPLEETYLQAQRLWMEYFVSGDDIWVKKIIEKCLSGAIKEGLAERAKRIELSLASNALRDKKVLKAVEDADLELYARIAETAKSYKTSLRARNRPLKSRLLGFA